MTPIEARDYLAILIEDAYERNDLSDEEFKLALQALQVLTPDLPTCKCGRPADPEIHPCPFQQDVNNDNSDHCNCCDKCYAECVMEI